MIDSNVIKYKDFLALMKSELNSSIDQLEIKFMAFSYQGFSPLKLFNEMTKNLTTDELKRSFIKDMFMLLVTYFVRGPNVAKMIASNTSGGDSAAKEIQDLVKKYKIVSKKPGPLDVTLPRLSMIFATISEQIYTKYESKIPTKPVTEAEVGIGKSIHLAPNYIPCLIPAPSLNSKHIHAYLFTIHCIYQSFLSKKTDMTPVKKTSVVEYFDTSSKFAMMACTGTLLDSTTLVATAKKLSDEVTEEILEGYIKGVQAFFSVLPKNTIHIHTHIHHIVNYCILKGKTMTEIPHTAFKSNLDTIATLLPLN